MVRLEWAFGFALLLACAACSESKSTVQKDAGDSAGRTEVAADGAVSADSRDGSVAEPGPETIAELPRPDLAGDGPQPPDAAVEVPAGDTPADAPQDTLPDSPLTDVPVDQPAPDIEPDVGPDVSSDIAAGCEVKDPLAPFDFGLVLPSDVDAWEVDYGFDALVTSVSAWMGDYAWDWELHFAPSDSAEEVILLLSLPNQYRPPVRVGEEVRLHVFKETPWWSVTYIAIWDADMDLRFFLYDGDGSEWWGQPVNCVGDCPAVTLAETDCEPLPGECGNVVHPAIRFSGAWGSGTFDVPQGETLLELAAEGTYKFFGVKSWKNVTMECDDYPDTWISAFFVDNFQVSQCACQDPYDCSVKEVCETEAHRCVANKCLDKQCNEGEWCDPYHGECFPPPPMPLVSCETTADCPVAPNGCGMVCNTYLGYCQPGICCVADCIGGCSDLSGGCYLCLSDCMCGEPFSACGGEDAGCTTCDDTKIGFTKDNPKMYEFYELCIPDGADAALPVLKQVDPTLYCGLGGFFADCLEGVETGCHGDLAYDPGSKKISDAKWAQLCSLSMLPYVSKIAGGHFLE